MHESQVLHAKNPHSKSPAGKHRLVPWFAGNARDQSSPVLNVRYPSIVVADINSLHEQTTVIDVVCQCLLQQVLDFHIPQCAPLYG